MKGRRRMTDHLEVQLLPAAQGDAVWIRWGAGRQLLIDMGTRGAGTKIRTQLSKLPEAQRVFDLLVVTHIDGDHVGGVLSGIVEADPELPAITFGEVWFNGWPHLQGRKIDEEGLKPMGPVQGEDLSVWLETQEWNRSFGGGPVRREKDAFPVVDLPDGLRLTVLGPTAERLSALRSSWTDEIHRAFGEERKSKGSLIPLGATAPPRLDSPDDLTTLAESKTNVDPSLSNATSICLLLEHGEQRVLLTGDGLAGDILQGLRDLAKKRSDLVDDEGRIRLDLVKMPHHGSQNNLSKEFVEAVSCPRWAFSTNGAVYRHPDAPAIGRLLKWSQPRPPLLLFNQRSTFSRWWNRMPWRAAFGYEVKYGTAADGITVTLP